MSGPGRIVPRLAKLAELHLPPGVPVLEFQDWQSAQRSGGAAALPWRGPWLAASAAGVTVIDDDQALGTTWQAALVHIQKGRAATDLDLALAWRALAPGGALYVLGGNDLGIATVAKRLSAAVDQPCDVVATGGHGRLARVLRTTHPGPEFPATTSVPSADGADAVPLIVAPGVFSHDGLDRGTAMLIECLAAIPKPRTVLDVGCGAGHLAIAALRLWRNCRALLLDADRRAVRSAIANLASLDLSERATVAWWSEREALPAGPSADGFDLALVNPPCHAGAEVSYAAAEAMLVRAATALTRGGRLLAVANRRLPYEEFLKRHGTLRVVRELDAFKIIEVVRG